MPRPEISPLHERLRRTALGLDRRNLRHHQLRALTDLDRMERPKWRRRNAPRPSPERIAWYARTLAEVYVAGSGDPVRGVFNDRQVAELARYYLTTLTDPISHEAVRQVWLNDPTGELSDLVKDWLPGDPRDRAVTLFLLADSDRYAVVDPSGALLESARAEGDPALRVQLAQAARRGPAQPSARARPDSGGCPAPASPAYSESSRTAGSSHGWRSPRTASDARLPPTPDGALLVGFDAEGELEVRRYRPSPLAALAERPLRELTGAETEAFYHEYNDPAETSLANLGAALLTHLRRGRPRDL